MFRLRRHCRIDGKANSLLQYPERRVRNKGSPIMNTSKHLSMIVEAPVCTNIPISFLKKKFTLQNIYTVGKGSGPKVLVRDVLLFLLTHYDFRTNDSHVMLKTRTYILTMNNTTFDTGIWKRRCCCEIRVFEYTQCGEIS